MLRYNSKNVIEFNDALYTTEGLYSHEMLK